MAIFSIEFVEFANFHGLPREKWLKVYKSGIFDSHDWEGLKTQVMYWPQITTHYLEDDTCLSHDVLIRMDSDEFNKRLNDIDTSGYKRGDMISAFHCADRNRHKFMWDGTKAIPLDYDSITDYGSISLEFAVPAFPPTYFNRALSYGSCIPLQFDESVAAEVNAWVKEQIALKEESPTHLPASTNNYKDKTTSYVFTYKRRKWCYVINPYYVDDNPFSETGFAIGVSFNPNAKRPTEVCNDFVSVPMKLLKYVQMGVPPENVIFDCNAI